MKKTKVIIPALGILLLSTAASVTGTVAWFTSSNAVSASGINIKIEKEQGFVIANESLTPWGVSAVASHDGSGYEFIPTSTATSETWSHAEAEANSAAAALAGTYKMLSPEVDGDNTGVYKASLAAGLNKDIFLLNNFYLKSSTTSPLADNELYAKVTATVSGTSVSTALNKALRVLVRYGVGNDTSGDGIINGTETYEYDGETVFAPFRADGEAALSYDVVTAASGTPQTVTKAGVTAIAQSKVAQLGDADDIEIPANNLTNLKVNLFQVQVYAYFEGEDAACFSDNITATLDNIAIDIALGTTNNL